MCDHCGHRKSLRRFVGRPEARKMVEENRPLSSPKICRNCTRKIAAGAAVRAKKDAEKKRAHQSEQDAAQKKLIAIEIGNAVQCGLASAEEYLQQLTQVVHVPDYRRGKGGGFKETKYTIPTVKRVPFHKEQFKVWCENVLKRVEEELDDDDKQRWMKLHRTAMQFIGKNRIDTWTD